MNAAEKVLTDALDRKLIVGAQMAFGSGKTVERTIQVGVRNPGASAKIDAETRFCIGSCSKPLVSATMLSRMEANKIPLDKPIDAWLPAFGHLRDADGRAAKRAPTMAELLSHRGGIFSQQGKITAAQSRTIRDFHLTLDESVHLIAKEPLLHQPGGEFAYSGAGYCVAGRAMEMATNSTIEKMIQTTLCQPLGLRRTTYFPPTNDVNVAAGNVSDPKEPAAPHLVKPMRLSLVGGSLYSTATDLATFSQLILNRGRAGDKQVLSETVYAEILTLPFPGTPYGYGWTLTRNGGTTTRLQHSGSLFSCRAMIVIDLKQDRFLTATWTLSRDASDPEVTKLLNAFRNAYFNETAGESHW